MIERGEQLALGEVAGGAEDDDDAGLGGALGERDGAGAVMAWVTWTVVRRLAYGKYVLSFSSRLDWRSRKFVALESMDVFRVFLRRGRRRLRA